jgi:hypothetical protein
MNQSINLNIIWDALCKHRDNNIPEEGNSPQFNQEWDDICFEMSKIESMIQEVTA